MDFFLCRGAAARQGVFGETPRLIDILCHPSTRSTLIEGNLISY